MKAPQIFRYFAPVIAVAFLISSSDMRADNAIPAAELQKQIRQVIAESGPAVVGLTPTRSGGAGSGVIVSEDGLILTAAHVINAGTGDEMTVWLTDGRRVTAKKLGSQTGRDAAMLQIVGGGTWPVAKVREGNPARGEWVVAMGHPGGFQPERTPPVRLGRVLQAPADGSDRGFLVSDCAVSGGDSGGPLFDLEGNVVGIHSSIGMSLEENRHVPISAYSDDWDRLVKGESWGGRMFAGRGPRQGAILGVQLAPAAGGDGAVVEGVVDNSPAAAAGIQSGDIIFKFSGAEIVDAASLVEAVGSKKPGDRVTVSLRRGEDEREIEVKLGDASKLSSTEPQSNGSRFEPIQEAEQQAVKRPGLGLRIADVEGGGGAEVMEVAAGSVAETAGVKAGDVVVGFAGKKIADAEGLVGAVREFRGDKAGVRLLRGRDNLTVEATFSKGAAAARRPAPEREGERAAPKGVPQMRGMFFDGKEMRQIDPAKMREMMRGGDFEGLRGMMQGMARPELGVEIEDGDKAIVAEVIPGSVAERSGFKKGDEIIELGGKKITDFESLAASVKELGGRWETNAKVRRGGKTEELHIAAALMPRVMPQRFGFRMEDGKLVPMKPGEFEKMVPRLRERVAPGAEGRARPQRERREESGRAQLGLLIDSAAEGDGLLVGDVAEGSGAAKAGVRAGDRILAFGEEELDGFGQLAEAVQSNKPGDKVKLVVLRDGKKMVIEVELGRAPADDSAEADPAGRPEPGDLSPEEMRKMMERMRRGEIEPEDMRRMFGGNAPFQRRSNVDPSLMRANEETLKGFAPATSKAKGSVVMLKHGGKQVAMGTVVNGGRIITKASQIAGKDRLQVERPDGKSTTAKLVRIFNKHDLALLELGDATGLRPVRFEEQEGSATVGTLITSPNVAGKPEGFGVLSVAARSLSEENKGFLGIQIGDANDVGVVIGDAFDGGAAQKAGLRVGDVISKAAGVRVTNATELIRQVAGKKPGDEIVINYSRDGKEAEVKVKLRSRAEMSSGGEERLSQTARMGTRLSDQRSGYPSALTHDMPVSPEACGSPLINLKGEVIGINIARAGRTKTYALPAEVVNALLASSGPTAGLKEKLLEEESDPGVAAALASLKSAREAVAVARKSYEELKREAESDKSLQAAAETARRAMNAAQESLKGAEKAFREIGER